jgi:NAD(P)H-hydrate epimerase
MENAGRAISQTLIEKFPDIDKKRVLVVCYHGNNGGDGFVAANYLSEKALVEVLFIGDESQLKEEAALNYNQVLKNYKVQVLDNPEDIDFNEYDIIIDAMLGTGTEGELKEPIASIVDHVNTSNAFKLAVDVPTGLNPDSGEVIDKSVNADLIVTFHDLKQGLKNLEDKTKVLDIGIPKEALE